MLVDVLWSSPLMINLRLSIVTVHKTEPLMVQINLTQFREPGGAVTTAKDVEEVDVGKSCLRKPLILQYQKGLMLENTKNLRYSARDRCLKIAQLDVKKSRSFKLFYGRCALSRNLDWSTGEYSFLHKDFDAKCLNSDTFDCDIMKRSWRVSKCQGRIQEYFGNGQK